MEKRLLPSRHARMARRVGEKLDLASDFIPHRLPPLFSLIEGCITGYGVVGRGCMFMKDVGGPPFLPSVMGEAERSREI